MTADGDEDQDDEDEPASDADTEEVPIQIEIPGANELRYVSLTLPQYQYNTLNRIKDEYGFTWRGLLVYVSRSIEDLPGAEPLDPPGQYEYVNEVRRRNGLTWRGMLLFAARDLDEQECRCSWE